LMAVLMGVAMMGCEGEKTTKPETPGETGAADAQREATSTETSAAATQAAVPAADGAAATDPSAKEPAAVEESGKPRVKMVTSLGTIVIELEPELAPITVENFLAYVDEGFYDGLVFHRVISNFMIQGGGLGADLVQKPTRGPIKNESSNGLKNARGTIAMARTRQVNSATSQFFINVKDNPRLDYPMNGGYCVFGRVVDGMDVVNEIRDVPTENAPGKLRGPSWSQSAPLRAEMLKNVPKEAVVIESVRRM
jgi:peptidyl-prolyl cis-trans isomerase A (cyclophilin A)